MSSSGFMRFSCKFNMPTEQNPHENQLEISEIWITLSMMFIINKRVNIKKQNAIYIGGLNNPDAGNHIRPLRVKIHH